MVFQPGQRNVGIDGGIEEPGMSIGHLLHPVPVEHDHGRGSSPIGLVRLAGPPTAVVPHAVVELEGMDLEQIEIHSQRRSKSAVARPTAPELGFHTVKAPAPVPMIIAFPEYRAIMRVAFVSPELPVNVPHPAELAG